LTGLLDVRPYQPELVDSIFRDFFRDGFVCVGNVFTADQMSYALDGANRVVGEQTASIPKAKGNRGFARCSFGSQIDHPEWQQLIDLPTILPSQEKIWGTDGIQCSGVGGDYSLPGAKIQTSPRRHPG